MLKKAKESATSTHNHPEGIKGAQAIALCIYLARKARKGMPVDDIRHRIEKDFGYDLSMCVEELRPRYSWNILDEAGNGGMCQGINSCIRASSYAARAELKPRFPT